MSTAPEAASASRRLLNSKKLYELLVRQIHDDGFEDLAQQVSRGTKTEVKPELPPQSLNNVLQFSLQCVQKSEPVKEDQKFPTVSLTDSEGKGNEPSLGQLLYDMTAFVPSDKPAVNPSKVKVETETAPMDDDKEGKVFPAESPARLVYKGLTLDALRQKAPPIRTQYLVTHHDRCTSGDISSCGRFWVTGSEDQHIKFISLDRVAKYDRLFTADDTNYKNVKPVMKTVHDHTSSITDLRFHPFDPFVASASADGRIGFQSVFAPHKQPALHSVTPMEKSPVHSMDFHPSGDFLLAAVNSPAFHIIDVATLRSYLPRDVQRYHSKTVRHVAWGNGGGVYASCGTDGLLNLWDARVGDVVRTVRRAHQGTPVCSAQFSANDRYVLTTGRDSTVRLWDVGTGREVLSYVGATQKLHNTEANWICGGRYVVSADEHLTAVVLWDASTGLLLNKLTGHKMPIVRVRVNPADDRQFISTSQDHRARLWFAGSTQSAVNASGGGVRHNNVNAPPVLNPLPSNDDQPLLGDVGLLGSAAPMKD